MIRHMRTLRGFTLIEMVMVIVITGIIAGMVAVFVRAPVQGYFDLESRVALTDGADTALRRIGRDLRRALPNSVTVSADGKTVSFLLTRTGGRYRAEQDYSVPALPTGNPLLPGEGAVMEFDVMGDVTLGGALVTPQAGEWVVVYNLGLPGADAYEGSNRAVVAAGSTGTNIKLASATTFPLASPGNRFQIVESLVSYACQNGALIRTWRAPPTAAESSAALVADVDCGQTFFTYDQNLIHQRWGLMTMTLSLTRNNETVTLYHEAHVSNVP